MSRRRKKADPRQLDMFQRPAYVKRSATSKAAAKSLKPVTLISMRLVIIGLVRRAGDRGRTCDELENLLEMRHQTCSARITELVDKGFLTRTEAKRKTRSGRDAFVYVAA